MRFFSISPIYTSVESHWKSLPKKNKRNWYQWMKRKILFTFNKLIHQNNNNENQKLYVFYLQTAKVFKSERNKREGKKSVLFHIYTIPFALVHIHTPKFKCQWTVKHYKHFQEAIYLGVYQIYCSIVLKVLLNIFKRIFQVCSEFFFWHKTFASGNKSHWTEKKYQIFSYLFPVWNAKVAILKK